LSAAFQHDVFVSYARADDGVPLGAATDVGWVTSLAANINIGPNVLRKDVFIDHRLSPGDSFSHDLEERVRGSRTLVLLLSQNYIDSYWCGREIATFAERYGGAGGVPQDVFVVDLCPFEDLQRVPVAVSQLRKHLLHAGFWYRPVDGSTTELAGYPSPSANHKEGEQHYWRALMELRTGLDKRLRALRAALPASGTSPAPVPAATVAEAAPPAPRADADTTAPSACTSPDLAASKPQHTVLLADCTEDLESKRLTLRQSLEAEGVRVLPAGDYVELSADEFDAAIQDDLRQSALYVQLLSTTVGRKPRGMAAPMAQLQAQRASASGLPCMQWCETLPGPGKIVDAAHALLFQTPDLRATHLTEFGAMVLERLSAITLERELAAQAERDRQEAERLAAQRHLVAPAAAVLRTARPIVFIDDATGDAQLSERLRALIRDQRYDVRRLPPGAPLGNNGVDVQGLLRPCRAGLTIHTDRNKFTTAYNRLVFFLNQVADGALPLARWGIVLEQGTVESEFGIESEDVVAVTEQGLAQFLAGL
jgi:hypothetical protein